MLYAWFYRLNTPCIKPTATCTPFAFSTVPCLFCRGHLAGYYSCDTVYRQWFFPKTMCTFTLFAFCRGFWFRKKSDPLKLHATRGERSPDTSLLSTTGGLLPSKRQHPRWGQGAVAQHPRRNKSKWAREGCKGFLQQQVPYGTYSTV